MTERREEVVLASAVASERFGRLPQLPSRLTQIGKHSNDPLVFPVELPLEGVAHDPDGADRLAVVVKRYQERLDESRFRQQRRKASIREMHQLCGVAIDADAARTLAPRHGPAPCTGEHAGDRFPPEHVAIEQADAGGFRIAEIHGDLDELLQHVARIARPSPP